MVQPYKRYYIYVAAVPAPALTGARYVHALVFPRGKLTPITEVKRFDEKALVFHTRDEAEGHALSISRAWVDTQAPRRKSRSSTNKMRN